MLLLEIKSLNVRVLVCVCVCVCLCGVRACYVCEPLEQVQVTVTGVTLV